MTDITDEELVKKVQSGDHDAYGMLVERYEAKLSRYGKRFTREDDDITDYCPRRIYQGVYQYQ